MRGLSDDGDEWICDEEGNLTPEIVEALFRVPMRPPSGAASGRLMARRVPVPVGLLLFLTVCTLVLFVIVYLHVR